MINYLHDGTEDGLCLTWISKRHWSLGRRLSTAHLAACWLVLLFSIATATTRPAPSFFSEFTLDIFNFCPGCYAVAAVWLSLIES